MQQLLALFGPPTPIIPPSSPIIAPPVPINTPLAPIITPSDPILPTSALINPPLAESVELPAEDGENSSCSNSPSNYLLDNQYNPTQLAPSLDLEVLPKLKNKVNSSNALATSRTNVSQDNLGIVPAQDPVANNSPLSGILMNLDEYNYSTGGEFIWLSYVFFIADVLFNPRTIGSSSLHAVPVNGLLAWLLSKLGKTSRIRCCQGPPKRKQKCLHLVQLFG
jgi:hypothetical protein